jgi:anthranilate synthase component 1
MNIPLTPSLEEFRELAKQGNLIPIATELIADAETPFPHSRNSIAAAFRSLESVEKSDQAGAIPSSGRSRAPSLRARHPNPHF